MGTVTRGFGGVATFVTLIAAAVTSAPDARAYMPHRSPTQSDGSRRMSSQMSPAATGTMCGHNAGGAPTPVACTMAYGNGQVISSVQVVPVFWTYGGKTVDANVTAWAPSYMAALVDSAYLDLLSEYSTASQGGTQTITRGTITKPYTITPTTATGASIKDSELAKELAAQVKAGTLPAITNDSGGKPNTLYMLFFPTGVVITDGSNSTSCVDFCGYHSSGVSGGATYLYAVIPDLSQVQTYTLSDGGSVTEPCGYGCAYEAKTKPEVDWFDGTVSHEIGEAVTDPVNGSGWYDQNDTDFACAGSKSQNQPGGGEIGDVCVGYYDDEYTTGECEDTQSVPGTNIAAQITWSNKLNGCYSANPATPPQCPAGGCVDGGLGPVDPALDAGFGGSSGGSSDDASAPDATIPSGSGGSSSGGTGDGSGSSSGGTGNGSGSSSGAGNGSGSSSGTIGLGSGSSGGAVSAEDAGPGGGSGNGNGPGTSSSSGCSCTTARGIPASPFALAGAALAFGIAFGRRQKRRG